MNDIIKISLAFAVAAATSGNLPKIVLKIRKAQIALIQESKASIWPKALKLSRRQ